MTNFVATVSLLALLFLNTLGNFWFTYGIWPKNWWAFVFFVASGLTIHVLLDTVKKETSK